MKLTELEPRWIVRDGRRIGFVFRCPTNREFWQSCFTHPPSVCVQREIFKAMFGEDNDHVVQGCNPAAKWTVAGDFETMTVTPSLDGSSGGLWHGHILNGMIVGGVPSAMEENL